MESHRARLFVWPLVALGTLWLVFVGGAWAGIHLAELRVASDVMVGVVLLGWVAAAARSRRWVAAAARSRRWLPASHLLPVLAAGVAVIAVATLLARQPRLGVEYVAYAFVLAALYLLLVRLMADAWFRTRMLVLVTALSAVVGVLYVAVVMTRWIRWWDLVGAVVPPPLRPGFASLTWGNPGTVLAMSVLLTAIAVAFVGVGTRRRATVSVVLVGLAAGVTLLSGSRAGWLAVAVAMAVTTAALLATGDARVRLAALLRSWTVRVSLVGIVVAGVIAASVVLPGVLFRSGAGGADQRGTFVSAALRMFAEAPLIGTGPGSWAVQRIAYTSPGEVDHSIPHAHNIYAQTLAELGVVGAIVGLVALTLLGRLLLRAVRSRDAERRRMGLAALFAFAFLAVNQTLDFFANFPAVLFAFAVPIAWIDATDPLPARPIRRPVAALLAAGAVATVVALVAIEQPAITHARAVALANEGRWDEALPFARTAAASDSAMPVYQLTLGLAEAQAGKVESAEEAFKAFVSADDLPAAWLSLADLQISQERPEEGLASLRDALRVGGQQTAILLAAADLFLRVGDPDAAIDSLARAIALSPSLAGDPWPERRPGVAAVWPTVIERATAMVGTSQAAEIALVSGDPQEARLIASTLPARSRGFFEQVIAAWEGDATARQNLADEAQRNPFDIALLNWCARLAARDGDIREVARFSEWAEMINGFASLGGTEMRVADGPLPPVEIAGISSTYHGHYAYRRPTPWDTIPAGLVHLTLQ